MDTPKAPVRLLVSSTPVCVCVCVCLCVCLCTCLCVCLCACVRFHMFVSACAHQLRTWLTPALPPLTLPVADTQDADAGGARARDDDLFVLLKQRPTLHCVDSTTR